MPRLVVCALCHSIEELPFFTGTPEEEADDPLLLNVIARHGHREVRVGGPDPQIVLMRVTDEDWRKHRPDILKELRQRHTGFQPEVYAVRNTFQEDALACFSRHGRPKGDCYDWREDSKLLTPSWKAEDEDLLDTSDVKKIEALLAPVRKKKPVYLCDFCPVSAYYTTKVREARGMYKEE